MRCETCVLLPPESERLSLEEIAVRLVQCDGCPIERGEAPCPPAAAALLMRAQREAARALRRQANRLRKAEHELQELRVEMDRSEARVATLEQLQKESHHEVAEQLRRQVALVERQRDAILALSTPIIQVWSGIVVLPLIGALDDARADNVMTGLLEGIQAKRAHHAVLDLTGVPDIDVATATSLLRVVNAARLLGTEVLLCGVRPQVAQTMTRLAIALEGVQTVPSLAEALRACGVGGPDDPSRSRRLAAR